MRVPRPGFGSRQLLVVDNMRPVSAVVADATHWVLKGLNEDLFHSNAHQVP